MRLGAGPYLYSIITYPTCKFFSRRLWRLLSRGGFAGHPHPAGGLAALLHLPPKKLAHGVNTTLVVSRKRISLKSLDKLMALALTVKKLFLSVGSTS